VDGPSSAYRQTSGIHLIDGIFVATKISGPI